MENIYIDTLELGVENLKRGISYNEVKRQLENEIPSEEFETAYVKGFTRNL